jgi:hypothetical protein
MVHQTAPRLLVVVVLLLVVVAVAGELPMVVEGAGLREYNHLRI